MPTSPSLLRLLGIRLVAPGEAAPPVSLTAEDGTWIRLVDLHGRFRAVLLFFRSIRDDATSAWLKAFDERLPAFEDLGAVIFGITRQRTDTLRAYRSRQGLSFHLLYDPLALAARSCGLGRPLPPLVRTGAIVVGEDGTVLAGRRGRVPAEDLLTLLSASARQVRAAGRERRRATGAPGAETSSAQVRDLDAATAAALLAEEAPRWQLLDVRTAEAHTAWHPRGAHHIPLDELPRRYPELSRSTDVICLSDTSGESSAAAQFLASVGFRNVLNVLDGTSGWPGAPEVPVPTDGPCLPHVFPPPPLLC